MRPFTPSSLAGSTNVNPTTMTLPFPLGDLAEGIAENESIDKADELDCEETENEENADAVIDTDGDPEMGEDSDRNGDLPAVGADDLLTLDDQESLSSALADVKALDISEPEEFAVAVVNTDGDIETGADFDGSGASELDDADESLAMNDAGPLTLVLDDDEALD